MNLDITEKWAKEIALMSDAEFEENCKHIETLLSKRKQALRIHDVSGMCEHPWASVIGDGEMKPAKCLKCGKYL